MDVFAEDQLIVPEACQECPKVREMKKQIQEKLVVAEELARAALFASPRTQRIVALERNGGVDPQRLSRNLAVEDAFEECGAFADKCQEEAAELSRSCAGVTTLTGTNELHVEMCVKLCGSDLLESYGDDEPVSVWRRS